MATVRAKFMVNEIIQGVHNKAVVDDNGKSVWEKVEKRTLKLSPVYSDDPNSENRRFWEYTPSGHLELGVVNKEAWEHFSLGQEVYVDLTPIEEV